MSSNTSNGIDENLVKSINEALIKSGERERLKQLVKLKLEQSGWFEQVKTETESNILIYAECIILSS